MREKARDAKGTLYVSWQNLMEGDLILDLGSGSGKYICYVCYVVPSNLCVDKGFLIPDLLR